MQYDTLSFTDAVEELAGRLALRYRAKAELPGAEPDRGAYRAPRRVAGYYHETLGTDARRGNT